MNDRDYEVVLAALNRALEIYEAQPVCFGFDREAFEKLRDVKSRVEAARAGNTNAGG